MKATVIAVFAALLAVAAAREILREEVFGECPAVDGPRPVYLMDVSYRNVFYECSNGNPIRQECPDGLVFDPRTNVCNFPCTDCKPYGPVGTCPTVDYGDNCDTFLRDGVNIAVYYKCLGTTPRIQNCARDMYFDMIQKKCMVLP